MGGKRMSSDKDTEKLVRLARRQGWAVEVTGGNHLRFVSPAGYCIIGGLSPSSNGRRKLRHTLVKAGLEA